MTPTWPLTPNWSCQECAFGDLLLWPSMSIIGHTVSEILKCWQIEERRRKKKLKQYNTLPRYAGRVMIPQSQGVDLLLFRPFKIRIFAWFRVKKVGENHRMYHSHYPPWRWSSLYCVNFLYWRSTVTAKLTSLPQTRLDTIVRHLYSDIQSCILLC